jgi:hypothetical protein
MLALVELLEYFDAIGRFHYVNWDPADGKICGRADLMKGISTDLWSTHQ